MSGFGPTPVYADPDNVNTNLVGVKYGALDTLLANFNLALQSSVTRMMMRNFNSSPSLDNLIQASAKKGGRLTHDEARAILFPQPASIDQVTEAKKDRPGIDIPEGVSQDTLKAIVDGVDNRNYWSFQAQQPAGTAATLTGYTTGFIAPLVTDPVAAAGGGAIGAGVKKLVMPSAVRWMETLATKNFAGAGAARLGTQIATSSVPVGATFAGFTSFQEVGEGISMANRGQTPQYQQAVLNIGQSFGAGLVFGAILETGALALGSKHFNNISDATKAKADKYYRSWTQDAAETARVDATAQMVDGKMPKVGDIINLGAIEQGAKFREALRQDGVDLPEFSTQLEESKNNIATEINTVNKGNVFEEPLQEFAGATADILRENPELEHDPRMVIEEFKKKLNLSDAEAEHLYTSISDFVPERAGSEKGRRVTEGQIYADIKKTGDSAVEPPENVQRRLKLERHVKELQEIAADESEHPTKRKKAAKYAQKLNENLPEMRSPTEELEDIRKEIMPDGTPIKNFRRTAGYKRLQELAKGSHLARNMLIESHLRSPGIVKKMAERMQNARINALYDQWHMADSMQRHVDGTHEPVTQADRKAYFEHLKSSGLDDIDFTLPDADAQIDAALEKFSDSYVKNLTEMIEKPQLADEWNELADLMKQQGTYKSMAKSLTDCIMKGLGA